MSSDLSISCRTRQWVFSSNQPSTSFAVQNEPIMTNEFKSMSPVSQLASQFSNQKYDIYLFMHAYTVVDFGLYEFLILALVAGKVGIGYPHFSWIDRC